MDIREIFEKFCSKYRVKLHPQNKYIAKIVSPFSMMNGDPISFMVEIVNENTLEVHDDLLIFRYYDLNYYEPSENALDIATSIIASYKMVNDDYKVKKIIDLTKEDLDDAIADYISGLIRLSDLIFLKRESIKKEFSEIVEKYIRESTKPKYYYRSRGIENDSYPLDLALSNDKKHWVGIHLLSNPSRVSEATISTLYYQMKGYDVYTLSIFDNLDNMLGNSKTKRLINLTDKSVIDFTDESKDIILSTIERHLAK